ncbi:hypothetical protein VNO80_02282 [Phaseolus coccineus]|uniref:Uncharacterized protein n=1 Tax=Phaseolus coccineus TaxID=3886 RepID=A0AAN9RHU3_PHACN
MKKDLGLTGISYKLCVTWTSGIKGSWSVEEDRVLTEFVEAHGPRNWALISRHIKDRSGKLCRFRWCNQLEYRPFTTRENSVILHAHDRLGNKWATVVRMFPDRTDNTVKNHWNATLKRMVSQQCQQCHFGDEPLTLALPKSGCSDSTTGFRKVRDLTQFFDNLGSNKELFKY